MASRSTSLFVGLLALVSSVWSQRTVPNSFPQDYPGKPSGDFSPEWQDCESTGLSPLLHLLTDHTRLSCEGSASKCNLSIKS